MSMLHEQALRDLMQRSTADLHAPGGVAAGIAARHRRRTVRRRALGLAVTGAAADFAARGSVNMIIAPNCADRIKLSASNRSEAVPYFAQRPWQDLPVCIDADLATFQSSCAGALCTTVEVRAAMPRKERALCVLQAS